MTDLTDEAQLRALMEQMRRYAAEHAMFSAVSVVTVEQIERWADDLEAVLSSLASAPAEPKRKGPGFFAYVSDEGDETEDDFPAPSPEPEQP